MTRDDADALHVEWQSRERDPGTVMITPLVLEIVVEKTVSPR
jgi:hypothetical protein